jgi:hypothetical protein
MSGPSHGGTVVVGSDPPPAALGSLAPALVLSPPATAWQPTTWGRVRDFLRTSVVCQPWFDRLVLAVIFANSVCLALDQPLADQSSPRQLTLGALDKVRGGT